MDADTRKSVTQVLMYSLLNLTKFLFVQCSQYLREKYLREKNRVFIAVLTQHFFMEWGPVKLPKIVEEAQPGDHIDSEKE